MDKIKQIKQLVVELNEASNAYYNTSDTFMSDKEFDNKLEQLKFLEMETGFVLSNSPTQNVGAKVLEGLNTIKFDADIPMLSLEKCHSVQEIRDFIDEDACYLSIKCDGLSTRLIYKTDGQLAYLHNAITRGNGEEGTDITEHIKQYRNVPLIINSQKDIIIDGESIIYDQDFKEICEHIEGKKPANSRNLASGTVNSYNTAIVKDRYMNFIAWRVIEGLKEGLGEDSHFFRLKEAENLGFTIVPMWTYTSSFDKEYLEDMLEDLKQRAIKLGLPFDGIVIAKDDVKLAKSMGRTIKHYRHSIAYKFDDAWYDTTLRTIKWETSRTGMVVPTGEFDTVNIKGADISRATLNNLGYFNKLRLHIGDRISVSRRNEVIPYIEKNQTDHDMTDISLVPCFCPSCGSELLVKESDTTTFLYCPNQAGCSAQLLYKLSNFVSKACMNIDGLSIATLEVLMNEGMISSFKDIYNLEKYRDKIVLLSGFGIKSYENLIASIEKSREVRLDKFINALGIPNIGKVASKQLAEYYNYNFANFYIDGINLCADYTDLKDFGTVTQNSLEEFFIKEKETEEVLELSRLMDFIEPEIKQITKDSPFIDKTFCITGSFACGKRDELQKKIEELGGKFVSGVSKKTDILVAGDKCGSKLDKAKQFGTCIIEEEELKQILGV